MLSTLISQSVLTIMLVGTIFYSGASPAVATDSPPSPDTPEFSCSDQANSDQFGSDQTNSEQFGSNQSDFNKSELAPFKYVGNSFSNKFHRPSCKFAKVISQNHLVIFPRRHNATDVGFVPCRWCLPPNWKTVHVVLLNPKRTTNNADAASANAGKHSGTASEHPSEHSVPEPQLESSH